MSGKRITHYGPGAICEDLREGDDWSHHRSEVTCPRCKKEMYKPFISVSGQLPY